MKASRLRMLVQPLPRQPRSLERRGESRRTLAPPIPVLVPRNRLLWRAGRVRRRERKPPAPHSPFTPCLGRTAEHLRKGSRAQTWFSGGWGAGLVPSSGHPPALQVTPAPSSRPCSIAAAPPSWGCPAPRASKDRGPRLLGLCPFSPTPAPGRTARVSNESAGAGSPQPPGLQLW